MEPLTITVVGATDIAPGEETDPPGIHAWERILAHAEAKARRIAAALRSDLGDLASVEEVLSESSEAACLRVTYRLVSGEQYQASSSAEVLGEESTSILDFVEPPFRPAYAEFRERLLQEDPRLEARAGPLRKGKRRYEGFRVATRNIIYAGFRKKGVRLLFEVPTEQDVPQDELLLMSGRTWRKVILTSVNQVEGALLLARDTLEHAG
jgi:hypothetical protein